VFGEGDRGAILYAGICDGTLWYVSGTWSEKGELVDDETALNMALDKS
jgi:hypothetical protein